MALDYVIPRNYDELQEQYGALIYSLLAKKNRIERNLGDLHSHVWLKLMEANLLVKFREHVAKQRPKVVTAIQACDMLGVSWPQWMAAMSAFHVGAPAKHGDAVVCYRLGGWMPTSINAEEFDANGLAHHLEPTALFAFEDIRKLAMAETFPNLGQDVRNGVFLGPYRQEPVVPPQVKVTKSKFRNYLTMSVLNHFANFCRTQTRRHKERPHTPSAHEDDSPVWEATLEDSTVTEANTMVALSEAREMLADVLFENLDDDVLCEPVEDFSDNIISMITEGSSIIQALKARDVAPRTRKVILDKLRARSCDFDILPRKSL